MNSTDWRKSSFSNPSGNCVEVKSVGERVYVRNSRIREATPLIFTATEWACFVDGVKEGEFDE